MRVLRFVLFAALVGGGVAFAGSKVPFRVVRVMPETHQALLYDKTAGTHVLVELGKTLDGYIVQDIDEDEVTLQADGGTEIVLAAPEWRHRADRDDAPKADTKAEVKPAADAPQDPYAAAGPQDPYTVRVAEAPAAPATASAPAPAPTVSAAPAVIISIPPSATPTPAPTTAAVTVAAPAPVTVTAAPVAAPAPAPAPAVAAAPAPDAAAWSPPAPEAAPPPPSPTLARADVNAALSNFSKLAGSIHGSFTADGARLDSIAPDSLFAKIGLRAGDVIASVNGQPLRSLDDAASLYARAPGVKALTLSVVRAGRPLSLRVVIQ
jgi:membrane-associated protease RseP (regulator of RpoE activity)